jgi:hypothetical protein
MAKFQFGVTLLDELNITARLADGVQTNHLNDNDVGKFVKLVGDSQYGLVSVGNEIEAIITSGPNSPLQDGYYLGGVVSEGRVKVVLDGLQATPGTGTIAIGDYVVAGTQRVARNVALDEVGPRVCKATAAPSALNFKWRVVALLGTGAVGQAAIIESLF